MRADEEVEIFEEENGVVGDGLVVREEMGAASGSLSVRDMILSAADCILVSNADVVGLSVKDGNSWLMFGRFIGNPNMGYL